METMKKRRECFTNFPETEYRFRKIRETLLEGINRQGEERFRLWNLLLFLFELLPEGLREFWPRYFRGRNSRNIFAAVGYSLRLGELQRSGW
jgi:hypothetical protein